MARGREPDQAFEAALRARLGERKYRRLQLLLKWTAAALAELDGIDLPRGRRRGKKHDPLTGLSDDLRSTLGSLIDRLKMAADGNEKGSTAAKHAAQRRPALRLVHGKRRSDT